MIFVMKISSRIKNNPKTLRLMDKVKSIKWNIVLCWFIFLLQLLECSVVPEFRLPWDFFEGNDAKAETPILWPLHVKSWLIWKDSDSGRDWGQEEEGTTEDEMAGWHHQLDGHEFKCTPGADDGQGGLACCDSWGRRVGHDWATELNWTMAKRPS